MGPIDEGGVGDEDEAFMNQGQQFGQPDEWVDWQQMKAAQHLDGEL